MEINKEIITPDKILASFLTDRIIFLIGEINDNISMNIITQLLYLDSVSNDDITIYINSVGGSITAGLAIIDTMNFIKSDVKTVCIGMAASMASVILASGTKNKRCALTNSEVMLHQPLSGACGQATDIQIISNRIVGMKKKMNQLLANLTGQPLDKIMKDCERDFYLSSKEALDYGLIDKIITKKED